MSTINSPTLFSGVEVEGKFQGYITLFVQGKVPYKLIKKALQKATYGQIYFGAKYKHFSIQTSDVDLEVVKLIAAENPDKILTVEICDDIDNIKAMCILANRINFIFTLRYIRHLFFILPLLTDFNTDNIQIKFFNSVRGVAVVSAKAFRVSKPDMYTEDTLVTA